MQKLRKETGIKISDNIIVSYSFEKDSQKLSNVCEKYSDYILKVLKVPFTNTNPDDSYSVHASCDYDIVTELDEKDSTKDKKEKPKEKLTKEQRVELAKKVEEAKKEPKIEKKVVELGPSEKIKITIFKK